MFWTWLELKDFLQALFFGFSTCQELFLFPKSNTFSVINDHMHFIAIFFLILSHRSKRLKLKKHGPGNTATISFHRYGMQCTVKYQQHRKQCNASNSTTAISFAGVIILCSENLPIQVPTKFHDVHKKLSFESVSKCSLCLLKRSLSELGPKMMFMLESLSGLRNFQFRIWLFL